MISPPKKNFQRSFFSTALEDFLNPKEGLYRLSQKIHLSVFEEEFGPTYSVFNAKCSCQKRAKILRIDSFGVHFY